VADDGFSARLWDLADLFTPMAVRVAATLRLADHVAAGAATVPALAERAGADADALGRLVGHLVTIGVFSRAGGSLALTGLGEQLRADGAWLDIQGAIGRADLCALHLLETVRTGRPAYPLTHGRPIWDDLAANPALAESFDALMGSRVRAEAPGIVAGYDWGSLGHVVDVGGGNGTLLAAILAAHPHVRGTLVDLPGAAEAARATLPAGCEIVAGSFFDPLPPGADAYVLSGVLQDWDDEHALAILRRCAEAGGRVLVIEEGLNAGEEDSLSRTGMDLRMLAFNGGRERALGDFERLAAGAGLRVGGVHRVTRYRSVIELLAA
jgi:2,7-dihydroxy-5-methyl-1-naphthoate 7-O-methyltransferase